MGNAIQIFKGGTGEIFQRGNHAQAPAVGTTSMPATQTFKQAPRAGVSPDPPGWLSGGVPGIGETDRSQVTETETGHRAAGSLLGYLVWRG